MNHNSYALWQMNANQTQLRSNSSVVGGGGGNAITSTFVPTTRGKLKIISINGQGGTTQFMETVASPSTDGSAAVYSGDVASGSYLPVQPGQRFHQPQRTATILNESILLQTVDGQYLVDERSIQNIDQIPPENLIYMTTGETVAAVDGEAGTLVASTPEVIQMPHVQTPNASQHELAMHDYAVSETQQHPTYDQSVAPEQPQQQYTEECQVTEEVITDDWVQSQDEECVQVTVDQLGASATSVEDDMPTVPLDQDEYSVSRPYPCDFCSRRFRKKITLQNHLIIHSNDRPYVCNLCGARYGRRCDLIQHLKQHAYATADQDELSFRNEQDVDYDFTEFPSTTHKHRSRFSSEDEDMYIQETMVNYNSQPPMQLISTRSSAPKEISSSAFSTDSMTRPPYANGFSMRQPAERDDDRLFCELPSIVGDVGSKRPTARKRGQPAATGSREVRPKHGNFASTKGTANRATRAPVTTANRYIKKEPSDSSEAQSTPFPVADERKPFVCQQCGVSFGRAKALESHSRSHSNELPYDCDVCFIQFCDQALLHDHIERIHGFKYPSRQGKALGSKKQFKCDRCSAVFLRIEHLKTHLQQDHCQAAFACDDSDPSQAYGGAIIKQELTEASAHKEREHEDRDTDAADEYGGYDYSIEHYEARSPSSLSCRDCGETFDKAIDLLDHAELHTARHEPYECQLCGEKFLDESVMKQHVQERHRHELTGTSCAICGKRCKTQTTLMKHAWDHSRERAHCCSKCGKTFYHMARLKRHMDSHRNKTVRCEVCDQEFPDGRSLMNHRHSHSKSNEYPCHECNKSFGSRSSQQIHMRIHTGERPYACRFCWKAFADGGTLRKHERIHTGEKPYACPVCPKAFNQRVVLREHIRAHHSQADGRKGTTDQQPFVCVVCSAPFTTTADLVQHLIEHSDTNTALKRKPPTFPRKYKRRRKLKPHELERLQKGRRKQKVKPGDDNEPEDDPGTTAEDPDGHEVGSLEYQQDGSAGSDASGGRDHNPPAGTTHHMGSMEDNHDRIAMQTPHSMLDDNGINLLSNAVLLHDQDDPIKLSNNHFIESPRKPPTNATKPKVKAKNAISTRVGSSRVVCTPKSKRIYARNAALSRTSSDNRPTRQSPSSAKDVVREEELLLDTPEDVEKRGSPHNNNMTHVMEAFKALERNRGLPAYVREIPSHRISSVSFPLLDDGNTDDSMDESLDDGQSICPTSKRVQPAAALENDQQPLEEMSRKERHIDRFNANKKKNQRVVNKRAKSQRNKQGVPVNSSKPKAKSKNVPSTSATARRRSIGGSTSLTSKTTVSSPPAVLRSQRLTRRQLEREVNFLQEAMSADIVTGASSSADMSASVTSLTTIPMAEKKSSSSSKLLGSDQQQQASERLASMLLNDGIPDQTSSGASRRSSSNSRRNSSSFNHEENERVTNLITISESMLEDGDEGSSNKEDGSEREGESLNITTNTTSRPVASAYRCSICAACFNERSQLILHVPVHI